MYELYVYKYVCRYACVSVSVYECKFVCVCIYV